MDIKGRKKVSNEHINLQESKTSICLDILPFHNDSEDMAPSPLSFFFFNELPDDFGGVVMHTYTNLDRIKDITGDPDNVYQIPMEQVKALRDYLNKVLNKFER